MESLNAPCSIDPESEVLSQKTDTSDTIKDLLPGNYPPTPEKQEEQEEYEEIEMYNSVNGKLKEMVYTPKSWVNAKLLQLKSSSSLDIVTTVSKDSVTISQNIVSFKINQNKNTALMQLSFFEDGIMKCTCINPANPSRFSFELVEKPANLATYSIEQHVTIHPDKLEIPITSNNTKVTVSFNPFNIAIHSTRQETQEPLFDMNTNNSLFFDNNLSADFNFHSEYLYGLAEHAYKLLLEDTKKDKPYRFFNQDVCGYPTGSKNALYGAIPLIISRKKGSPTFVSLYWQNTSDTYIDIHKTNKGSNTYWLSERGNLECYIFANNSTASHFKAMSNVFGHAAMPQYFSLGYHQCRYSYKDQKDVLEVNANFNKHEIPCDTITLDIDHTDGKRYFTWDKKLFPDPEGMQKTLVASGRQLVTICDPHIKLDKNYHVYKEIVENDLYIKTKRGQKFVGKCWPGDSIYIDYLNEEARANWASQYSYEKYKHSTPFLWAWNDMNEPSVFELPGLAMPLDNLQTYKSLSDPHNSFQVEHREVHNIYGHCMSKGTYDGLLNRNKDKNIRPHVLSRSFFAGSQKYTAIWTGDTRATWPYLKTTVPMLLSLSLCGISFVGGDVGGFVGNPEPELAVRWYQLGTFMPYFRAHSECNCKRREPWLYVAKYFRPIKEAIKERYKLLPYWYTCFEEHCRTAVPVMRPVWFDMDEVEDPRVLFEQEKFMIGDSLLVVPVLEKGKTGVKGFLRGLEGRWYDYYTKREVEDDVEIKVGLERIGCFVKGGNIVPMFEIGNKVRSSKDTKECGMSLYVAVDEEDQAKGKVYFDDGETFDYRKGEFVRKRIGFEKGVLSWEGEEGGYKVLNKVTKVVIVGVSVKYTTGYLEEGQEKRKVEVVRKDEHYVVEFVADANSDWKIYLS